MFRELHSIDGCNLGDVNCRRRRCLLQDEDAPLDELILYAFMAGIPKAFQLAPGCCVNLDQYRRQGPCNLDVWPTGSQPQNNRPRAPPNPNDLPRIYVCKSDLNLLQAQHPPYHDGDFNETPYVLVPQWSLGPLGTLHHNLKTLGPLPDPPPTSSQEENAATSSREVHPTPSSWKHETQFKIYPHPLRRHISESSNYKAYAFQFPGAPAVDENDLDL